MFAILISIYDIFTKSNNLKKIKVGLPNHVIQDTMYITNVFYGTICYLLRLALVGRRMLICRNLLFKGSCRSSYAHLTKFTCWWVYADDRVLNWLDWLFKGYVAIGRHILMGPDWRIKGPICRRMVILPEWIFKGPVCRRMVIWQG